MDKSRNKGSVWISLIIILLIVIIGWVIYPYLFNTSEKNISLNSESDSTKKSQQDSAKHIDTNYLKAITSNEDTNIKVIRVSEKSDLNVPYGIDDKAGSSVKRIFTGRRLNIAVIGVDARLGTKSERADANQVISILIDKGIVEITSIPRDTPADAGYPDSSGQNKLTIVHAAKGQKTYLEDAANIAGLDKIHYYVEFGFSQAMGIIELFGYKDPRSTLQVLRSRKGLGGDDYQRCYNQGQFIRQMLLHHFDKFSGFWSELFLRGGLALVNTNLTYDVAKNIIKKLSENGFPKNDSSVTICVRPPIRLDYKVYDFTNQNVISTLKRKIENFNENNGEIDTTTGEVEQTPYKASPRLWYAINHAVKDTAKYPARVIAELKTYYDQRAWLQVSNKQDREKIREQICFMLISAYNKTKKPALADEVKRAYEAEKKLFSVPF